MYGSGEQCVMVHVSKFKAIEGKHLTQMNLKIKTYNVKTKNPRSFI